MAEYVIQFESRALPGQDSAYDSWYQATHLRDMLNVPGVTSAKRYTIVDPAHDRPHHMAAYVVDCDDPHALLARLFDATKSMEISPALDPEHVKVTVYKPR